MRPFARRWSHRPARASVLIILSVVVATVLAPGLAVAHGALKSSIPAAGARLNVVPRELRLTFTEAPELAVTTVEVLALDSTAVALGPLRVAEDRRTVAAAIRGPLAAGTYTVIWKVVGADGHPVRGRFRFTIHSGAAGLAPAGAAAPNALTPGAAPKGEPAGAVAVPGQPPVPTEHHDAAAPPAGDEFGAESPAYVILRWFQFTLLLLVIGAVAFRSVVLRLMRRAPDATLGRPDPLPARARARAVTVGLWAAAALALVAVLRLYAQSFAMHGSAEAMNSTLVGTMLAHTVWGWGWFLQAAGVGTALAGFAMARRAERRESGRADGNGALIGWTLATLGGLALAFAAALSGHAAAAPSFTPVAVIADAAHVLGASGWMGGLALVVFAGVPAALSLGEGERGQAVADLVNAFSPTALTFAGVTAATGVFEAWLNLGSVSALWQSPYGRLLLLKLGVLSLAAGTGAYNWLRVKPTLGDIEGAHRIRRSASTELAIGIVVLLITAVLVATPPPVGAAGRAGTDVPSTDSGTTAFGALILNFATLLAVGPAGCRADAFGCSP